ncbi:MAG: hypothetical protein PUB52_04785 [Lachnospiraceae bacterium]|nr:hypothetical protein [Lachnospiraceae bacterium]
MIIAFFIWSIVAAIFLGIGISCRKSSEAVGFFTFVKPPVVDDIRHYNNAVSVLWIVAAVVLEMMGVPFLFLEQNSPVFILIIFAVILLIIVMILTYIKIEEKYKR